MGSHAGNRNLHDSHKNRQDEFYTQLPFIETELKHYRRHFRGKSVLCNCDDPYESNFFKYFAMNFNKLGLRKLTATCYATSPILYTQLSFDGAHDKVLTPPNSVKKPYKVEITQVRDMNGDGQLDMYDVAELIKQDANVLTFLEGDGDFRSDECVSLLKDADIVVTNPPFSLFREYLAQLLEYDKEFLIVGNQNAITYKEVLPLVRDNKIWLGYQNGHYWFRVPDYYEPKKTDFKIDEHGKKWRRMGNICWFTNLDIRKRHEDMILVEHYSPERYPKYDAYDAIEVGQTRDIPDDYYGVMGVPITFMQYYSPGQFEILGDTRYHDGQDFSNDINYINGKLTYRRLLIRRKQPQEV